MHSLCVFAPVLVLGMEKLHIVITLRVQNIFDAIAGSDACIVVIQAEDHLLQLGVDLQTVQDCSLRNGAQRHIGMLFPVVRMQCDEGQHIDGGFEYIERIAVAVVMEAVFCLTPSISLFDPCVPLR